MQDMDERRTLPFGGGGLGLVLFTDATLGAKKEMR